MEVLACIVLAAACPDQAKFNRVINVGDKAPGWQDLEGVDGHLHSRDDYREARVLVVVFICNHCPVAAAYEDRVKEFVRKHQSERVRLVAISCSLRAEDRLEKMKERRLQRNYNFDYLIDPSQKTGRTYGATVTPQFFVLDEKRRVAYMGAFDDHIEREKVEEHYVNDAVRSLLEGRPVDVKESRPRGCEIEFRKAATKHDPPRSPEAQSPGKAE